MKNLKTGLWELEHTLAYDLIEAQTRCKGSLWQARNSEIEGKVFGERADWVHYHGKIEGKDAGIAF